MNFNNDKAVPVKHLSTQQLKAIYDAHSRSDTFICSQATDSIDLMAEIQKELSQREFIDQVRGNTLNKSLKFDLNNPYVRWGLIGGGTVIGLLLIQFLTRPAIHSSPYRGMNQINIYR